MENTVLKFFKDDGENKLECERLWVFLLLMSISGFYGAFTYTIRGGVFCNAQTANFVLFAMPFIFRKSSIFYFNTSFNNINSFYKKL